jgi:hypothetical protein
MNDFKTGKYGHSETISIIKRRMASSGMLDRLTLVRTDVS